MHPEKCTCQMKRPCLLSTWYIEVSVFFKEKKTSLFGTSVLCFCFCVEVKKNEVKLLILEELCAACLFFICS